MAEFAPLMPHGELEEVFPDVFFVTGTVRPTYQGVHWQFSRNMIVVRDEDRLTLINSIRLNDSGLAKLETLGTVANLVKLGAYHGIDDAFYLDRYRPTLWALPGMQHDSGATTDVELRPGGEMPFSHCSLFMFETSSTPEGLLLIAREGGILIACDSLQNWRSADSYFNDASKEKMTELGFIRPANVGPGWLKTSTPEPGDFAKVLALPFRHLLSAHGQPLRNTAHEELSATFAQLFQI